MASDSLQQPWRQLKVLRQLDIVCQLCSGSTGCDQVKFRFGHMYISALKLHAILNFYEKFAKIDKVHIKKVQTINALGNFMKTCGLD